VGPGFGKKTAGSKDFHPFNRDGGRGGWEKHPCKKNVSYCGEDRLLTGGNSGPEQGGFLRDGSCFFGEKIFTYLVPSPGRRTRRTRERPISGPAGPTKQTRPTTHRFANTKNTVAQGSRSPRCFFRGRPRGTFVFTGVGESPRGVHRQRGNRQLRKPPGAQRGHYLL